jgi:acetylornithine deacetylase/succinyl-diaminopimelate desuccinylase-like protein
MTSAKADLTNLTIDPQRLWDSLMETARFGATVKGGIRRLTLSDEDRQVRDWFRRACEAIGCTVTVDDCGNMFARRPGRRNDLPPICMGSHLDTQPTGGKFDGTLGVLGALEVMRTLHASGYETNAPIEIVNWTNEEGSRFAPAMLASGVFAGAFTREFAYSREDRDGKTLAAELERIGYRGDEPVGTRKIGAMFELHIEQGPILEAEGKMAGVVTGVQGMRWYEVTVRGQEAHTGATPMHLRRNALLGAARMIEAIDAIALHGRFRGSDLFRRVFETIWRRCIREQLVGGEGFAVDASLIKADANRQSGASSQGNASVSWRAIHSAVGFVVTLIQTRPLRSSRTMMKAYSRSKPMVGTTNRSIAAISGAWLCRCATPAWRPAPLRHVFGDA